MPAPRPTPIEEDGQINSSELTPATGETNLEMNDTVIPDTDPNRPLR